MEGHFPSLGVGLFSPTTGFIAAMQVTSPTNDDSSLTINTGEMLAIKEALVHINEQPYQPTWEILTDSQVALNIIQKGTDVLHL
jgi:ribonuclease HI